jgi:Short C-terminal domain
VIGDKALSDARRILDERLAKGEIDEAEYDKLVAKLDTSVKSSEQTPVSKPTEAPKPVAAPTNKADSDSNKWVNVGIFVAIVLGLFFWNRSSERSDGYDTCIRNNMFSQSSDAGCSCLADQMVGKITPAYYLPIVGGMFFRPSETEITTIAKNSLNYCKRRFR